MSEQLPVGLERVHMVGIGGAGMSGIARILLARGGQVSGSDAKESRGVLSLRARGAVVRIGHDASALDLLPGGPTAVVTTHAAIPKDNPELVEAAARGIPVILRPAVLASLMQGHRTLLVSGTHGKTSTTSMLVVALQHCGFDPSFAVGGELNEAGTNAHHGTGDVFVAEADESDGSLLQYDPDVVIVTNVEADHLDFFGTSDAYVQVFDDFVARIAPGGLLVACLDDPGSAALARRTIEAGRDDVRVVGYGTADGVAAAGPVPVGVELVSWEARDTGGVAQIRFAGEDAARTLRLGVPGKHMALNALAALLAGRGAGASIDELLEGLAGFGGVHRRFQFTGRERGVRVFDDYAHHPTEVRAVLGAASDLVDDDRQPGRVVVVFQPHLYSRTVTFAQEFGEALDLADEVVVLDVYGAREEPLPGVSGALVAQSVTKPVHYQPDRSQVPRQVASLAEPGDVVITMGAGDVTMLGGQILDALRARPNGSRSAAAGSGSERM
ncbi:UDP-N-acetylmuramate--L-alanine ligase [Rhodococcus hoagii]|jgi:UDP-N-acetylmuramate--alanine ligase|uniref:UDP-N-acetylmuramate--L-alanine ligase n=3 Tax=Rhodococcus hoagii TaxID=43767 RepID=E9T6L0_RHOHA|nr:UDP-N-acetylmuramate--L-alanine ligase [Prescottella equi]MBU4617362.1 UDP-N-acetylmuramate--L-alanine ligase [Rhodococcus sp. GG48]MCD7049812.1 UDP-N-acetylmuramate--L-alanine ligase [Rhodococcus sp. BH2-1]GBF13455.1 UDP-N-acetylmuramate--L-alanine ligase [Rhodococcus sp. Br-6]AVP69066.1 UDP-N-acetylmuramate--L-alanine ligase [Prescottella equi]EGD21968.1 UDP-N-acetylmuramate--L-alanine ligase [Prescottella equi ATCC 33707]